MKILSDVGRIFWVKLEIAGNKVFTPAYNPFYYLGAIAFHLMYLLFITGAYLLFFYTISVSESYSSLEYLMKEQWYLGGTIRSLHRYATDGLMLVMVLHLLREFFYNRYRSFRWVAWVSGVALLFSVWISALIGYWLVWDTKAQVIALFTAELIDFVAYLDEPMSISFQAASSISTIFFFVILFFHITIPTFLLFVSWLHYSRISKPVVNPPRALSIGIFLILLALAFISPASMDQPANLAKIPDMIRLDWFLMVFFPLQADAGAQTTLLAIGGLFLFLFVLPWIPGGRKASPVAEIIQKSCTGCKLCHEDCPYEAITLHSKENNSDELELSIVPQRCSGCGICLGSCDFNAVRMNLWTNSELEENIKKALSSVQKKGDHPTVLAFVCDEGVDAEKFRNTLASSGQEFSNIKVLNLPCVGILNSNMIEKALALGADGVFISGCGENDCYYRLGNIYLEERMAGSRAPTLDKKTDLSKIRTYFSPEISPEDFLREVKSFMDTLTAKKPVDAGLLKRKPMLVPAAVLLAIPAVLIWAFSGSPVSLFDAQKSMLKVGFKHKTPREHKCTDEEIRQYRQKRITPLPGSKKTTTHMDSIRKRGEPYCGKRERNPATVEITIDGEKLYSEILVPSGLHQDGSVYVYRKFFVEPGDHDVLVQMRDTKKETGFDYEFHKTLPLGKGDVTAITFEKSLPGFMEKK